MCLFIYSSRPPEGHDPGPSESSQDMTDLAIVKIEKVEDDTGGLLMQVDNGQGDGQRHYSVEDYDDSDLTGDFSQDDMSNEASLLQGDPSGAGAMYMGPTSGKHLYIIVHGPENTQLSHVLLSAWTDALFDFISLL